SLISHKELQRFVAGGFLLNYVLMSFTFVLPILVDQTLGARNLWKVLVPAMVVGLAVMRVMIKLADKGHFERVLAVAYAGFLPGALCLMSHDPLVIEVGTAFFMAGSLPLMGLLPGGATRSVAPDVRGSASGIFQSAQYIGAFSGGACSGVLWQL